MPDEQQGEEQRGDPWEALAESLREYKHAVAKEEAGTLAEGERTPADMKPGIDNAFWRLMGEQVTGCVQENLPEHVEFDERLTCALNFGVLKDDPDHAWAFTRVAEHLPAPKPHPDYAVVYVTAALDTKYREVLKIDTIRKLNEQLDRIKKSIEEAPGEREVAMTARDHAIVSHAKDPQDGEKLKACYKKLDGTLETYKMMEKKNREGGFGGQEERSRYIALTQERTTYGDQVEKFLAYFKDSAEDIRKHDHEADESLSNLISLRDDKRQKEKQIDAEKSAVHNISVADVKAGMDEMMAGLKGNGRLTAKLGKAVQISVPLEERDIITPDKAIEALSMIEEFDPKLFDNRGVKRKGKPELFIVPGIGEGVYEWEGNRLLVPTMYTRSQDGILASVASAVVQYRVDVDQSYCDREMILSYRNDIKENKAVKSMMQLRKQLTKDYMLWMTKESKGLPLMEKSVREWFEYRIGPNKYEPKFPRDLRNLSLKQQREMLEAEQAKSESQEVLFRQALLSYLMDSENVEHVNTDVIPKLEKAYQPGSSETLNLNVLYSLAALLRKVKNKKCTDLLIEYSKTAPPSWWGKKAIELVNTFR